MFLCFSTVVQCAILTQAPLFGFPFGPGLPAAALLVIYTNQFNSKRLFHVMLEPSALQEGSWAPSNEVLSALVPLRQATRRMWGTSNLWIGTVETEYSDWMNEMKWEVRGESLDRSLQAQTSSVNFNNLSPSNKSWNENIYKIIWIISFRSYYL